MAVFITIIAISPLLSIIYDATVLRKQEADHFTQKSIILNEVLKANRKLVFGNTISEHGSFVFLTNLFRRDVFEGFGIRSVADWSLGILAGLFFSCVIVFYLFKAARVLRRGDFFIEVYPLGLLITVLVLCELADFGYEHCYFVFTDFFRCFFCHNTPPD